MLFQIIPKGSEPPASKVATVYLRIDHWNDYSFITMFDMLYRDTSGDLRSLGSVKIGFKGQTIKIDTHMRLQKTFEKLGEEFFSLGADVDYYKSMFSLPSHVSQEILEALRDIVKNTDIISSITDEKVFSVSLLRDISLSTVKGKYARVLEGKPELTDYKFKFIRDDTDKLGAISLSFDVKVASTPSTSIHAIIGRNGVGKTTLLNGMIEAITHKDRPNGRFLEGNNGREREITPDYFSSLVSVSFSAFDPFTPPSEQPDPAKGTCYFYIGLRSKDKPEVLRTISDLHDDCIKALARCFCDHGKTGRWLNAIRKLGSDENFAFMKLEQLEEKYRQAKELYSGKAQADSDKVRAHYEIAVSPYLSRMSSGHAIVLLTITRLVATVEEKTLVILDEPESHLHPPLLSAFIRALSDLLYDRNGVAIIATHSPVVLQEIPRSCIWKLFRVGYSVASDRPGIETFAENVGKLTGEVFGLEVEQSGFHDLLAKSVNAGYSYDAIVRSYDDQIGLEGRAILAALLAKRDKLLSGK